MLTVSRVSRRKLRPLACGCKGLSTSEKEAKRRQTLDQFLRVDHAGEYGADRIYAGQLAVLGNYYCIPLRFTVFIIWLLL